MVECLCLKRYTYHQFLNDVWDVNLNEWKNKWMNERINEGIKNKTRKVWTKLQFANNDMKMGTNKNPMQNYG